MREPIFYGGESAYSFQYRDFSVEKYGHDEVWLSSKKGFSIQAAAGVVRAIGEIQNTKVLATHRAMLKAPPADWTILPGFCLSAEEVECISGVSLKEVKAVLDAFTLQDRNTHFSDASAFNSVAASPLIPLPDGRVLLLQYYSIVEALYESPFYWMAADDAYKATVFKHQGVDERGAPIDRTVEGFHARVVQHECDHLIGRLYPTRMRDLTRFGFTDLLFPTLAGKE